MSNGPITLSQLLPRGVSEETFIIVLAGVVALATVFAISRNFTQRDRWSSRIRSIQQRRRELATDLKSPKKRRKPETSVNFMRMVAMRFELVKKLQLEKAETTLMQAGLREKDAILVFAFFNLLLPIVLGVVGFFIMKYIDPQTMKGKAMAAFWPVLGLYLGLKLPWFFINRARSKRYLNIQRSLSDTLDLMTVCAEAGLSLGASLDRVSRELNMAYPEMAEELSLTAVEMGFLPDRNKALSNLGERCDIKEMHGIVTVLIQTEKYGTPIAQALRVLSMEFRQSRMMRAEGKAARLPALMTVPMIVFILPTLFIIIIAPAAIGVLNTMDQQEASSGK
jgi:tight adherence protein C